uniref:Hydroxypyruvate isomerase (putative) n=1 Tax=Canis lupus familiaris TaxID=9615 RepID=A0A8I3NXP8_CANLF
MHFSPGSAQPCPACLRPGSALPARSAAPSPGSALPARPAAPSPPGIRAPRPPRCTLPSGDRRSPPAPLHPPLPGSALPAPARSAAPSLGRLRAPRPPRCTLPSRDPRSPPAPLHPPLRGSALPRPPRCTLPSRDPRSPPAPLHPPLPGSALPARPAAPSPPGICAPRPPRCTLPSGDPRSPPAPLHPPLPGSALPARPAAAPSPPGIGAPRPPRCTLPPPGSALPARPAAPSPPGIGAPRPPRCTLPSRDLRSPPAPLHPPLRGSALPARPAYFRSPSGPDSALLQGPRRPWLRSVSRPTCRGCSPSSPGSPRGCGRPAARASRRPRWPGRTRSRPRQWLAPRGKRGCGWCSSTRPPVRRGAGAGAVVRPGRRAGAEARSLSAGDREKGEMGLGAVPGRQAAFREGLEQAVLYARALGCPRIHLMAGRVPQGADRAAVRSEMETVFLENLRHAAGVLAQENLVGLLEPINTRITDPQYFLDMPQQAAAILQKVGRPNLQLQMDLFHWQIMDGNLTGNIREFLPLVGHVQVAQVPGRGEPDSPGELNFPYLFQLLEDEGYKGFVGCEYRPLGDTAEGLNWLRSYWERRGRPQAGQ